MSKSPKIFLLVGLMLVTVGVLGYVGAAAGTHGNLDSIAFHRDLDANVTNGECSGCHPRASTPWQEFHRYHARSVLLQNYIQDCKRCHKQAPVQNESIDGYNVANSVSYNGDADLQPVRKISPPRKCVECHGKFSKSMHGDIDFLAINKFNCKKCHGKEGAGSPTGCGSVGIALSPVDAHAGVDWIRSRYSRSKYTCWRCHGGLPKYELEEPNDDPGGSPCTLVEYPD